MLLLLLLFDVVVISHWFTHLCVCTALKIPFVSVLIGWRTTAIVNIINKLGKILADLRLIIMSDTCPSRNAVKRNLHLYWVCNEFALYQSLSFSHSGLNQQHIRFTRYTMQAIPLLNDRRCCRRDPGTQKISIIGFVKEQTTNWHYNIYMRTFTRCVWDAPTHLPQYRNLF